MSGLDSLVAAVQHVDPYRFPQRGHAPSESRRYDPYTSRDRRPLTRKRTSKEALDILEGIFASKPYITALSPDERDGISVATGMSDKRLCDWWRNRRSRDSKHARNSSRDSTPPQTGYRSASSSSHAIHHAQHRALQRAMGSMSPERTYSNEQMSPIKQLTPHTAVPIDVKTLEPAPAHHVEVSLLQIGSWSWTASDRAVVTLDSAHDCLYYTRSASGWLERIAMHFSTIRRIAFSGPSGDRASALLVVDLMQPPACFAALAKTQWSTAIPWQPCADLTDAQCMMTPTHQLLIDDAHGVARALLAVAGTRPSFRGVLTFPTCLSPTAVSTPNSSEIEEDLKAGLASAQSAQAPRSPLIAQRQIRSVPKSPVARKTDS